LLTNRKKLASRSNVFIRTLKSEKYEVPFIEDVSVYVLKKNLRVSWRRVAQMLMER